ncbi:ATPase [Hathewaya histolytica]|uniref:Archaeal/vacuolar-type H+-ATPase subunit H n=1 Tax=Hathewaya histolytica TaxID=1498 RepID=A0A4U9RE28_HATHI|nr:ATPase [Hathewaya histolytica]VTQ90075.1 archaeal/vacuolar-type H+-ATPase subunit H [Hathewaya histolytica]
MDVIKLLEYLQEILETSSKIPVVGKVLVDKKEMNEVIEQIIEYLPEEFKKASWISEEKDKILKDAHEQAEMIKKESVDIVKKRISSHDYVKKASSMAEDIVLNAEKKADIIKVGARDYALDKISYAQNGINANYEELMNNIKKEMENFIINMDSYIKATTSSIDEDIEELKDIK